MLHRTIRRSCALLAALVLLAGGASAQQPPYVLGPDDVIEITVYGYPDLSRLVTVLPDGTVSIPLVGIVHVAGLTVEQAARKLTEAFSVYLRRPQVSIVIKEFRRIRVSVMGQVTRPGTYELKPGATVLDALAAAGGLTEKASVTEARLVPAVGESRPLHLEELLVRQEMRHNVALQGGETLVIPEELRNRYFVLGDVGSPGVFVLRGELTVLQALAQAGGPVQRGFGTARSVHILRRTPPPARPPAGVKVEPMQGGGALLTVDLRTLMSDVRAAHDLTVAPGDIIVVPQTGLSGMQYVLGILSGLTAIFR